jgi:hypothetical protein
MVHNQSISTVKLFRRDRAFFYRDAVFPKWPINLCWVVGVMAGAPLLQFVRSMLCNPSIFLAQLVRRKCALFFTETQKNMKTAWDSEFRVAKR